MATPTSPKTTTLSPPSDRCSAQELPANPFSSYSARAHKYAGDVLTGKVLAGRKVRLAAHRFLNDLERASGPWKYIYDAPKADATCALFELFVHEKGELMGHPVRLGDWQCFIFCNIFGWLNRETGYRRFRESFILVPRGNGKSPMAAWVTLKMAFFDGEGGAEVYNAATTEYQAFEVFRPAKGIVDLHPTLAQRIGVMSAVKSLYQPGSRSRVQPVIGKPKDGKAPHCVTNDEYHEQPDDLLYDSFKRGMNKRRQSLMFNISTAGDTVEGPCHRMQEDVQNILEGLYENDRMFGLIYDLDEGVDWTTREACVMTNPNFGVSIDEESMLADLAEAVRNPAKQNGFRCKNQNFWAQQASSWMNMKSWDDCRRDDLDENDFAEHACYLGSDLASALDLSATVKVFVREREDGKPIYTCFSRAYLPERRALDPKRQHLQAWVHAKRLIATKGSSIDYAQIENDTVEDIERFQVRELAYDRRYADQWSQQVTNRTGVIRTEIAPSQELLSPAMKELEGAVEDGRFEHDGHPVLKWCVANLKVRHNQATGNYYIPPKDEPEKKIDAAIALIIAMARARFCISSSGFIDPEIELI
ncbi:MAG: terminase large subunit [Acidobacteriota bacterium]|nr:terminase large subunit [Acidobacteriota bacterium]